MSRTNVLLWIGYVALLAPAVWGVGVVRQRTLATLATPAAQAEWEAWREETKELSQSEGPMKRRVAKATEPPLLILLRDHYKAVVGSAAVTITIFYWLFAFLIRGSMRTPAVRGLDESEQAV